MKASIANFDKLVITLVSIPLKILDLCLLNQSSLEKLPYLHTSLFERLKRKKQAVHQIQLPSLSCFNEPTKRCFDPTLTAIDLLENYPCLKKCTQILATRTLLALQDGSKLKK